MEGWVDLCSLIAARPGIDPTTAWSQVRRPNRYATKPPDYAPSSSAPLPHSWWCCGPLNTDPVAPLLYNRNVAFFRGIKCPYLPWAQSRLVTTQGGSTENAGLENEGQKWNSGMNYVDRKMQDNFAGLENAGLENARQNRRTQKWTTNKSVSVALDYVLYLTEESSINNELQR